MKYYKTIHDIVKIESNVKLPKFKEGKIENADITLNLVDNINIPKKNMSRLDYWFYGKEAEECVLFEDTFLGLKNQMLIQNIEQNTEKTTKITFNKEVIKLDKYYPPRSRKSLNDLINSITELKLIEKGYTHIHASCLSKNGKALVFAAYPNVGKTLSTLQLLKQGYKYMSDDTILVDRNGNAYLTGFPSAIGYNDFLKFINPEDIGKSKYYKILIRTKIMDSNKLVNRLVKPPLISLGNIFKTTEKSKVTTLCTLEIAPEKIVKPNRDEMVEKVTNINNYSLSRLNNPFIWVYSYYNKNFSVQKYEELEKENLRIFLNNFDNYFSLACNNWNWLEIFKKYKII